MIVLEAIGLDTSASSVISIVGGGGKTTCMFRLAAELKKNKKKVLVTTTTKIYYPKKSEFIYDEVYIGKNVFSIKEKVPQKDSGCIVVAADSYLAGDSKLHGFNCDQITNIYKLQLFDFILIEADGARQKPVKAPGKNEPVIPKETSIIIGMIGFTCFGRPISEKTVHRVENFCSITGTSEGEIIDREAISELVKSTTGLFKGIPANATKIFLINQVDTEYQAQNALALARYIAESSSHIDKIIIAQLHESAQNIIKIEPA
jgi:probable selenium-dependent hydroxylase accessory protein YqeC